MSASRLDGWGWVFAVGSLANALWMLAGPMHWYTDLPAAVPDTEPFNPHFVRDIGCAFLAVSVAHSATTAGGSIFRACISPPS